MDLLKKYNLKKGFKPGELLNRSKMKIKRVIVNRKSKNNALGQTDGEMKKGKFIPKKVIIYKGEHGKDKGKQENRIINTIAHEEAHIKKPNATEKQVAKLSSAQKVKAMPIKEKQKLYSKYKKTKGSRKNAFMKDEKEGIKEYQKAIKSSKGQEKKTYKSILPDEKKHLGMIKRIK